MADDIPLYRIGAQVSGEAERGWTQFAELHGIDKSALIEAFGSLLAEYVDKETPQSRLPPNIKAAISNARKVQIRRRARREER